MGYELMVGGGGTGREEVEAKLGELKPYCYWNISTRSKYAKYGLESNLMKALEEAGLKRGFLRRKRFMGDDVKVEFEYESGTKGRIKVELYARGNESGEKMRGIIQRQIDTEKYSALNISYGDYSHSRRL